LRAALALFDAGVAMMRQNLRRADPQADDATISARLQAWLTTRPGAEHGDAEGRPIDFPRSSR
jgi:hypothetical protein